MISSEITGIVLAGGMSRRMGQDKSLMEFRGMPLISHAVNVLLPVCSKVVISSDDTAYSFTGCEIWPDELPVRAPMIGLYSCLKRTNTEWNIVLSCDMPLMDPRLFEFLMIQAGDYETVIPAHSNGDIEPLCGFYNRSVLTMLENKIKLHEYGMQKFLGSTRCRLVEIDSGQVFYNDRIFSNINTREDFDILSMG
jgi:molybdopterin-guanine dinucleotide biosynthesis protein A